MKDFAKLYHTDHGQVLVTYLPFGEEEEVEIKFQMMLGEDLATLSIGFGDVDNSEVAARGVFDKIDKDWADAMAKEVVEHHKPTPKTKPVEVEIAFLGE